MKIGILTFHCAHNYGAVIQCYGLQQYLRTLGHEVCVIDYRPKYHDIYKITEITISNSPNLWSYLKGKIREFIIGNIEKTRFNAFEDFIHRELKLAPYIDECDYSDYNAIILGSDQIWNPDITGGNYDKEYFGSNAKCTVISYAASCRSSYLTERHKSFFQLHLPKIHSISVRETSLMKLLQPLTSQPIKTVIDPSFLLDISDYEKLCKPVKCKRPYVLVYEVERHTETSRIAKEIAQSLDADIIELVSCAAFKYLGKKIDQIAGPIEFLSYIKDATCVVTSSFHGLALSLKFQKDFYSIKQGTNADLRAESLLTKIGLLERFVPLSSSVAFSTIDYSKASTNLANEISSSKDFLLNSLKNVIAT